MDETPNTRFKGHKGIGEFIEKFDETIHLTCKETLKNPKFIAHICKGKVSPLVEGRSHNTVKKDKFTKKKVPTNAK